MASGFHPKVTSTALAGALTSILIGEANRRGLTLAPDEAAAVTVLLSFVAGYFMPNSDGGAGNGAVVDNGAVGAGSGGAVPAGPQPVAPPPAPVAPAVPPIPLQPPTATASTTPPGTSA